VVAFFIKFALVSNLICSKQQESGRKNLVTANGTDEIFDYYWTLESITLYLAMKNFVLSPPSFHVRKYLF